MKVFREPIPFTAPFVSPCQRPLEEGIKHRLLAWCDELASGVEVDIEEWVGADPRHPLHALVVSFRGNGRSPVVLHMKVDEVRRSDLVQAYET